jgi:hypothetical protein
MTSKLAFGALGLACVVAAGGGAYLAARHNTQDVSVPAEITAPVSSEAQPKPAATAETEAVIEEPAKAPSAPTAEAPESRTSTPVERPVPPQARVTRTPRVASSPSVRAPLPSSSPSAARRPATPTTAPTRDASVKAPTPAPAETGRAPLPAPVTPEAESAPAWRPAETSAVDNTPAPREPQKTFEELVVSPDSVIGLQIETALSSERARIEDRVEAKVTRDVKVGDRVAIPAGSRMLGTVTQVERGGKLRDRARLGVRFQTLVLADGSSIPVSTDTLYREGDAPTKESAAKIGGATVGGAILGAILGGGKGAAAGAAAGAAGGTAAVMAGDRNPAVIAAGSNVTVRLMSPVTITVAKE